MKDGPGWVSGPVPSGYDVYSDGEPDAARRIGVDVLVPVFVDAGDIGAAALLDRIDKPDCRSFLSTDERERLDDRAARGVAAGLVVIHTLPERVGCLSGQVISVGPPLARPDGIEEMKAARSERIGPPTGIGETVVAGVIDDGIGYLNSRFRASASRTRFEGVWIMGPRADSGLMPGLVLSRSQINDRLSSGRGEADIYRTDNEAVFPAWAHRPTDHAFGHGTHVLDLAAGAKPGDPAAPVLFAVQLPPESIVATSGRRLEHHILQGLRWMLHRVRKMSAGKSAPRAVIVTLSLGTLAGPRDGTGFFERCLRQTLAEARDDMPGIALRVVAAYGNSRRDRLTGHMTLEPGEERAVHWRVLPEDFTPSHLEIRMPSAAAGKVAFSLSLPDHAEGLTLPRMPDEGQRHSRPDASDPLIGVYATAEGATRLVSIGLAPTAADRPRALNTPGVWRVILRNSGTRAVSVSLRVRRDDTPEGFRLRGRQSYLDEPDGWTWDDETKDWSAPSSGSVVTRDGTETSFASSGSPDVYVVAAGETAPFNAGALRPALYSGQDDPGGNSPPTMVARAEDGRVTAGRLAAGVLSGGVARVSGTSVAAPLVAAGLIRLAQGRPGLASATQGTAPDPTEVARLLSSVAPLGPTERTGAGALAEPAGRDRNPAAP